MAARRHGVITMEHSLRRKSGGAVMINSATLQSPAWRAMSHGARSLYIMMKDCCVGDDVVLSTRQAADALGSHSSRGLVMRWFRELQHFGFITSPDDGRGIAPRWRLTDEQHMGNAPTRDFLSWTGAAFRDQNARVRTWTF
jgi:hypothetical protein